MGQEMELTGAGFDLMQKLSIELTPEQSAYIDQLVTQGRFASVGDVIEAGLKSLRYHEEEDRWLRQEVVPALEAIERSPESLLTLDQVFDDLQAQHEARLKSGA